VTFDWTGLRDTLKDSVVGFLGGDVTIERAAEAATQPIPGRDVARETPTAAMSADFSAVLSELDIGHGEGDIVSGANAMFVVSPGDFEPRAGDKLTRGDRVYEILQVRHTRPDGAVDVVHECMVSI